MPANTPTPSLDLIPLRPVVTSDRPTTLDVLIKILPPNIPIALDRPPLNLALVIDQSGSMWGQKLDYARQAACYAVQQLLPSDRVSVVAFDSNVKTLVTNRTATEKDAILRQIQQLQPGSSTALHAGWVEGGMQVGQKLKSNSLNRVLLLSDGLANVGETNPDAIASDVHGLAQRGISTSTLGIGDNYDEDLMEAMARSGDGNFYHIESPTQIPAFFQTELQGLMATVGHTVSLGLEPQNGVTVADVLNDLDKTSYGRLKLPNLIVNNPLMVVVRLSVPPTSVPTELCQFRLAWNDPDRSGRQILRASLHLPVITSTQLNDFPPHPEVQEQVALLMAARARQEAIAAIDLGDVAGATIWLGRAQTFVAEAPASATTQEELGMLDDLQQDFSLGKIAVSRKKALFQSSRRHRGYTQPMEPPSTPPDPPNASPQ